MTQPPSRTLALASRMLAAAPAAPAFPGGKRSSVLLRGQDAVNSGMRPDPLPVDNAGLFGARANLPTDPGPPEPNLLPGTELPDPVYTSSQNPSVQINAGDHSGDAGGYGGPGPQVDTFSPFAGEHWLGGGFKGVDPDTGKPIYDPLGYVDPADLGGIRYTGVDRVGGGRAGGASVPSGNPFTVASKRAGHSGNWWVF